MYQSFYCALELTGSSVHCKVSSPNPALGGSMLFGELKKRKRLLEICAFQEK
jgi:hypothetical protein